MLEAEATTRHQPTTEERITLANERDYLMGQNVPSAGFGGVTGFQWGFSVAEAIEGKRPTEGAPMRIDTSPIGLSAINDTMWKKTYGASMDCFLSLVNGQKLQTYIEWTDDLLRVATRGINRFPNASNLSIYKRAVVNNKEYQQIQYVASKETVQEAASAAAFFGDVDEARTIGLRMPTVVGGWGRSVNLLHTDNGNGDFNSADNSDELKMDRNLWKFGPLDLRWDQRRGVWAAFNDMIVDHDYDGYWDTMIFGTMIGEVEDENGNPAASPMFPFLRAGWSDAFWVRSIIDGNFQNNTGAGLDPNNDAYVSVKTGELMTHLGHYWFDATTGGAARLSSIFLVNHGTNEIDPGGSEENITRLGGSIDISTDAHFAMQPSNNASAPFDGPLAFSTDVSGPCGLIGDFVFYQQTGKWHPRVSLPSRPCAIWGGTFFKLTENDARIGASLSNLCNDIANWTEDLEEEIFEWTGGLADPLQNGPVADIQQKCQDNDLVVAALAAAIGRAVEAHTNTMLGFLVDAINSAFVDFANSVQVALLECGCPPGSLPTPIIVLDTAEVSFPDVALNTEYIPIDGLEITIRDCNECTPIIINGVCATPSAPSLGIPCVIDAVPDIAQNGSDAC
jgi:hypothetical protein